jgi:hypothetical protein
MSFAEKVQLSRRKVHQAEQALESYWASGFVDSEESRKLANAVKAARDEYLNQLSELVLESPGLMIAR